MLCIQPVLAISAAIRIGATIRAEEKRRNEKTNLLAEANPPRTHSRGRRDHSSRRPKPCVSTHRIPDAALIQPDNLAIVVDIDLQPAR